MIPAPACCPLFFLVLLFAPLGVIAPKAIVPLLLITALMRFAILCSNSEWRCNFKSPFKSPVAIIVGLISVCALTSVFWSLNAVASLITVAKFVSVFLAMLILLDSVRSIEGDDKDLFIKVFLVSYFVAVVILCSETLSGAAVHGWFAGASGRAEYGLTVLNRAGIVLLLAAWPAALMMWQKNLYLLAFVAILAPAVAIFLGVSNSNTLAFIFAFTGALLAWILGPRLQMAAAIIFVVGILVAPIIAANLLKPERITPYFDEANYSALHRFHIWHFTGHRIAEKPILGWGMDAARRIPGGDKKLSGGGKMMEMHPHNATLQIWLELGAVGALIAAISIFVLWRSVSALADPAVRSTATAMLLSALTVANLSFGIWQTWWMAVLAASAALWSVTFQVSGD